MKSKQILDIQQMQHLQELGMELDYDTLCRYVKFEDTDWLLKPSSDLNIIGISCKYISAYTLQDVLDALPKEIKYAGECCWLCFEAADERIGYYNEDCNFNREYVYYDVKETSESNIIDSAYRLLCWAIENKFVETNKNE